MSHIDSNGHYEEASPGERVRVEVPPLHDTHTLSHTLTHSHTHTHTHTHNSHNPKTQHAHPPIPNPKAPHAYRLIPKTLP